MAPSLSNGNGQVGSETAVGLLTRTVIRSPVTHWILHARLRHKSLNDAVFVGSDFVHVRQVGPQGHLEHIATKDDFDAHIRAAAVYRVDPDPLDEDFLVKVEDRDESQAGSAPPDLLVLTLSTNDLVFIYLEAQADGTFRFVAQSLPLPTFDRILFQPGEHLAIDPLFRALAVAANEREVIIYSAKARDKIAQQIRDGDDNWCPVAAQRPLQVDGAIQHMDFMIPPDDDTDHIILLLIVVDRHRTKAIWIDWHDATGLHQAEIHPGQPLSSARTVSSLLIPLRKAAFLLVTGKDILKYQNLLSGSVKAVTFDPLLDDTGDDSNSPLQPLWASWCKPHRYAPSTREQDHIYLVREDGLVLYIYAQVDGPVTNISAGHLKCHVGKAFASLGQTRGPDILAVAGETSTGRVISIGHFASRNGARLDKLGWEDTMEMDLIQTIPNWASSTDLLASSSMYAHSRMAPSRDALFVTSGRQPYGTVTELKYGLEARSWARVELNDMHVVTAIWALPMAANGSLLLMMTTPTSTRAFELDALHNMTEHDTKALDLGHRTLAAAVTGDGHIVQVTEDSVSETSSLVANFEDTTIRRCAPGNSIRAAAIDASLSLLVTAERNGTKHLVRHTHLPLSTREPWAGGDLSTSTTFPLPSAPLVLGLIPWMEKSLAAVATAEHGVIILMGKDCNAHEICRLTPAMIQDTPSLCDDLVLLRSPASSNVLVVCGLRDGTLAMVVLSSGDDGRVHPSDSHTLRFGQSAVRVAGMADHPSRACVMAGPDTCLLDWTGPNASSVSISSVWYSDKGSPELAQGAVLACARVPTSDFLATAASHFAGSLAIVSGNDCLLTHLGATLEVVPRQLPVSGTPNRLIYAHQQKCLIVASSQSAIRAFPTPSAQPESRRQTWPTIDFIPSRASEASFSHDLQPGERVHALLEWSHKHDGKTYSSILVGGSYKRRSGPAGGRVTILQPALTGWEVTSINSEKIIKFDAPVYALALYDELTYVVCYGEHIGLNRYLPKEKKWTELCRPLLLHSPGVFVTVAAPLIYVSTHDDSLNTLRLNDEPDEEGKLKLVLVASGPQADKTVSHVIVQPHRTNPSADQGIALLSTTDRWVVGLSSRAPADAGTIRPIADDLLFKALLPRSLTRLRQSVVRPPWKAPSPDGVLVDDMLGMASDGTLVGLSLLDDKLRRRLSWLQRLCEWSERLSPHSYQTPLYTASDGGFAHDERPLPVGLSSSNGAESEIVLHTSVDAPTDKHIDGDVLARLLERGGADTLRALVRETAAREDYAGTWMREHLDEELEAVDEVIELVTALLEHWL